MPSDSLFVPLADARPDDAPWPSILWPVPVDTILAAENIQLALATEADAADLFNALDHDAVWTHVKGRPASPTGWVTALGRSYEWCLSLFGLNRACGRAFGLRHAD